MEQMVLAIRETGSTGELEKKLEEADKQLSYYRKRTENLQKQVSIKTKNFIDLKEQLVNNSGVLIFRFRIWSWLFAGSSNSRRVVNSISQHLSR